MRDLCGLIGWMVVDLIRSRAALEAEIWTLRQQINVLRRTAPKKLSFSAIDRLVFVGLYRFVYDPGRDVTRSDRRESCVGRKNQDQPALSIELSDQVDLAAGAPAAA
jgi:hypothetical protein